MSDSVCLLSSVTGGTIESSRVQGSAGMWAKWYINLDDYQGAHCRTFEIVSSNAMYLVSLGKTE